MNNYIQPSPYLPTEPPIVNGDENYGFPSLSEEPTEIEEEECDLYPPIPVVLTDPRVRWLVEPIWAFDAVFPFAEGMAAVEFHEILGFSDGLAWVRQGRWWGIIELTE